MDMQENIGDTIAIHYNSESKLIAWGPYHEKNKKITDLFNFNFWILGILCSRCDSAKHASIY